MDTGSIVSYVAISALILVVIAQWGYISGSQVTSAVSPLSSWLNIWGRVLIRQIPYALVLFGFIKDAISEDFRYSIASIIGMASIVLNYFIGIIGQKIVGRQVDIPSVPAMVATSTSPSISEVPAVMKDWDTTACSVPGFDFLDSIFAPQALVLPAAMFTYILIDMGSTRTPSENIGVGTSFMITILLQFIVLSMNKCYGKYYFGDRWYGIATWLIGILVGASLGSLSYLAVYKIAPDRLISKEGTIAQTKTAVGLSSSTPSQNIINVGEKTDQSAPVDDQDQFVCDAYKDGELITSTIVD